MTLWPVNDTVIYTDANGNPNEADGVKLIGVVVTDDGELMTTATERERNVYVSLAGSKTTDATSWFGLIDKSDTTNWPHDQTGRIDISAYHLGVDKANSARGSISIGVITRVDGTSADVSFIAVQNFLETDTPSFVENINYAPSQIKCSVANGKLTRFKTMNKALAVTAINTGTTLPYDGETFVPAVGDIVVRAVKSGGGNYNFDITLAYHGED